jgi:diazepam-binding inhibitor (GABA receptor modulator, acyl-CoA-binding protein)
MADVEVRPAGRACFHVRVHVQSDACLCVHVDVGARVGAVRQTRFQEAARKAEPLSSKASNEDLLAVYGLYKQATVGDVNTGACTAQPHARARASLTRARDVGVCTRADRPGMFDLKGKAKWDAWNSRKGVWRPLHPLLSCCERECARGLWWPDVLWWSVATNACTGQACPRTPRRRRTLP